MEELPFFQNQLRGRLAPRINLQPASDIEDQPADLQTPSGICRPFAQWFEAQEVERALPPGYWSILKR